MIIKGNVFGHFLFFLTEWLRGRLTDRQFRWFIRSALFFKLGESKFNKIRIYFISMHRSYYKQNNWELSPMTESSSNFYPKIIIIIIIVINTYRKHWQLKDWAFPVCWANQNTIQQFINYCSLAHGVGKISLQAVLSLIFKYITVCSKVHIS